VLILNGKDLRGETLANRRANLTKLIGKLKEPVRESSVLDASLADILASVKAQGLEAWWQNVGTATTNLASDPALGRRCASTRGRSL